MNKRDCPGRRAAFALLVALSLIVGFSAQLPQIADSADAVAAIPGHHYTSNELGTYSKDQLIALVLSMQQERESDSATTAVVQTDSQPHHSRLLGVIGEVLGGIGVAMLVGHMESHNTGQPMAQLNMPTFANPSNFAIRRLQPPGLSYASAGFFSREKRARLPAPALPVAPLPAGIGLPNTTTTTCNPSQELFCNVNVTQNTCTTLQAAQGMVGTLTPLWTGNSVSKGTNVDPGSVVRPNSTSTSISTSTGNQSSQQTPLSTQQNLTTSQNLANAQQSVSSQNIANAQQSITNAMTNAGYSPQQAALVSGHLAGGQGVALLNSDGKAPTKTDGGGTSSTYVSAISNFAFAVANAWVGCNYSKANVGVTTSKKPK